jgi:hypothetical protein
MKTTDLDTICTRNTLIAKYLPPAAIHARQGPTARTANSAVCPPLGASARSRSLIHLEC